MTPRDALFRLPDAVAHDDAVDAWLSSRPAPLRPIAARWFARLRACGDDIRETMHDGCATACVGDAAFAHVGVYAAHVSVYFFDGASLPDPKKLLEGAGKRGRHVKLKPGVDVDEAALGALIDAAVEGVRSSLR